MNANFFQTQIVATTLTASLCDPQDDMLNEVGFKWLMAGQGYWVDTTRLRCDSDYAHPVSYTHLTLPTKRIV